jgi:hypothetical protein
MTDENPPDWKCRVCKMSDDLFALDEPEMCRRCYDRACSEGATKGEELPWNDDCVLCGGEVFQPETPSCSLRKIKLASLAPEPSSPAETLDLYTSVTAGIMHSHTQKIRRHYLSRRGSSPTDIRRNQIAFLTLVSAPSL